MNSRLAISLFARLLAYTLLLAMILRAMIFDAGINAIIAATIMLSPLFAYTLSKKAHGHPQHSSQDSFPIEFIYLIWSLVIILLTRESLSKDGLSVLLLIYGPLLGGIGLVLLTFVKRWTSKHPSD